MAGYICEEGHLFLRFVGVGAVLLLGYSFFLAFRQTVRHSRAAVFAEDLFFWLLACLWISIELYRSNQGTLRGFLFLGAGLGFFVCRGKIQRIFVEICRCFLEIPVFIVKKMRNLLLFCGKRGKLLISIFRKRQSNANKKSLK